MSSAVRLMLPTRRDEERAKEKRFSPSFSPDNDQADGDLSQQRGGRAKRKIHEDGESVMCLAEGIVDGMVQVNLKGHIVLFACFINYKSFILYIIYNHFPKHIQCLY